MARHRMYFPDLPEGARPGQRLEIGGDEAHHAARVKRLEVGEDVGLHDGRGRVALARVAETIKSRDGWRLVAEVTSVTEVARPTPRLHVIGAAPKGERIEAMADGLAQVGAAAWSPLLSARTVVEPREGKLSRLARTASEALKQSGGAWLLEVGEAVPFDEALRGGGQVVLADASGAPWAGTSAAAVTLLIGPEGGWSEDELAAAQRAGATMASFGVLTMRTEVAAVVAAGIVMSPRA